MTTIVRLAFLGVLLTAAPAGAADVSTLFGAPAVSEDELGAHRAKGEEMPLDQSGNPASLAGGMSGTATSGPTPSAGSQGGVNIGQNGSFRGLAVGVQSGSVSQSGTIH